jgi:serine/threonine protein kinase
MTLSAGSRLGPYGIVSPLGAGGMGEVYRARDSRLNRDVAIKVLPDLFAGDADRLARLRREAQVLASLNHSNIAQIYGFEDSDGVRALVMELVEGPTLADRIARGPIPLDEGLPIALQIAQALEAAHEQGIIHRDLKPANIKAREDGAVKVLAKALDPQAGASAANPMTSPTLSVHATQAGLILGTAAYMSPEQARGKAVDRRTDIWAFGVVLFEMLAGRRLFGGVEITDTLAEILKSEPDWHALPPEVPPAVHRLLRRCLQKDPRQRLQHIGDARLEIEEVQRGAPSETGTPRGGAVRRERVAWASALVALGIIAAAAGRWGSGRSSSPPEIRVDINTPPTANPTSFALSPDGRKIVFTATTENRPQLWLRSLEATAARPLTGTDGGVSPFWSPDSRSIGFFSENKLKRLDVDGGQVQTLANVLTPAGGTWNQDGLILYVPADNGGVFRVSATGTDPRELIPGDKRRSAMRFPQFLPDGRRFLFHSPSPPTGDQPGVYVGEVGSDRFERVLDSEAAAGYASGHLLFVRQGALVAQSFDPATLELHGPVTRVVDDVTIGRVSRVGVSASVGDTIAYRTGAGERRRFIWFDRSGKSLGDATESLTGFPTNPSLSPDGRRLAISMSVQENIDLWLIDLDRNILTRATLTPTIDAVPTWSPDGNRIVFNGTRGGVPGLFIKRLDGTGEDELLIAGRDFGGPGVRSIPKEWGPLTACDWSPDGRFVLVRAIDLVSGAYDLWALPIQKELPPVSVVRTPYDERDGQFSPDGTTIAYQSDESGRAEIYLQPFPGAGSKVRVSTNGGMQVRWRRDGRELFYIAPDNGLMSVSIAKEAGTLRVGSPVRLFQTRTAATSAIARQQYVVAAGGQRFLINTVEETATAPITLLLNWRPATEAR